MSLRRTALPPTCVALKNIYNVEAETRLQNDDETLQYRPSRIKNTCSLLVACAMSSMRWAKELDADNVGNRFA